MSKARQWTAENQIRAEVMAACGCSKIEIGKKMGFSDSTVGRNLNPIIGERARERCRQYYLANSEKRRDYDRQRRLVNPEKVRGWARQWRLANQKKIRDYARQWHLANPEKSREIDRRRRAMKRAGRLQSLFPLTLEQKHKRFALFDNCCAYCGAKGKMTVDHVLALNKGGHDEAQNVIPACRSHNCSKNNRMVEQWYRRQPFFTEARWRKIQRHCPSAATGQLLLALAA